jgi:hypothetical protein
MTPWYSWAFDGVAGAAVVGIGIAAYQRYASKADRSGSSPRVSARKNSLAAYESPVSADMTGPIIDSQVAVGSNISQSVAVHHHYGKDEIPQKWISTEPTPIQILREIDAASPFDREHARKKYEGLIVVWEVTVFHVRSQFLGWTVLTSFSQGGKSVMVRFHLISVTAELKSATEGSPLLVRGTIESIVELGLGIQLKLNPEIRLVKRP